MRLLSIRTTAKVLSLAILGFALGLLGISAYESKPTSAMLPLKTSGEYRALANACVPNNAEQTDEIFFLSCGGIF